MPYYWLHRAIIGVTQLHT